MITEDYVSFETAKLLKEKGFNERTNMPHIDGYQRLVCYIPTLQMAMKWLREAHDIHPNIVVEVFGPYALYRIDRIFDGNEGKWVVFKSDDNASSLYNKPEEACEAVIKYCLENLI